jgi:pimeloyl-ACP methyl ester carboxylesterase
MQLTATRRASVLTLVGSLLLVLAACGRDASSPSSTTTTAAPGTTNPGQNDPTDPFYVAPSPLPAGKPGDIIRSEPLAGAPAGAQAWKVLYLSQGFDGSPTAVSGVVIAPAPGTAGSTPQTGAVGTGGRPIVSWAHPTTGLIDACAPSTLPSVFALIPGLESFLAAGYVVAATDYEGLGTAGVHPYLIGESEGRSVLDAARAARNLPDTGAGDQLLLWGHSQGGQASLFAGQMAPSYAPELHLVGAAAAAPAGELAQLLSLDSTTEKGIILGAYAVNTYADLYAGQHPDISASQVVTAEGLPAVAQIAQLCDLTQSDQLLQIAGPLTGKFFVGNPGSVEPWSTLLAQNSPGGTRINAPVLITQGTSDTVIIPSTTTQLVATYCANGTNATEKTYPGVTHELIGYSSANDVAAWMASLLVGSPPAPGCPRTQP